MQASLQGSELTLKLHDPGWLSDARNLISLPVARSVDDLVPDHEHLMHLYVIRQPGLDVIYHLHPAPVSGGSFRLALPSLPAGTYKLYADIVHKNGFPETLVATIKTDRLDGRPLEGDDAMALAPPVSAAALDGRDFLLPDGFHMHWVNAPSVLIAKQPTAFEFTLVDAQNKPPEDMALYMGMLGHAAFVKTDGTVFAHLHPNGSVSMAAFMQAQQSAGVSSESMPEMGGMQMNEAAARLPNVVRFPYGFPTPGRYRLFVQMKHSQTIETAVFDADVH
jgi:hypothetical protein